MRRLEKSQGLDAQCRKNWEAAFRHAHSNRYKMHYNSPQICTVNKKCFSALTKSTAIPNDSSFPTDHQCNSPCWQCSPTAERQHWPSPWRGDSRQLWTDLLAKLSLQLWPPPGATPASAWPMPGSATVRQRTACTDQQPAPLRRPASKCPSLSSLFLIAALIAA